MTSEIKQRLRGVPGYIPLARSVRGWRFAVTRRSRADAIETYLRDHEARKLQLGAGRNLLPGWLNTDVSDELGSRDVVYLDVRKRFPFRDATFDVVFSEHMIEHLDYRDGLDCLRECRRVLRADGRIRIATPSLERLVRLYDDELTDVQRRYVEWSVQTWTHDADAILPGFVLNNFMRDFGHRFVYDRATLTHALQNAGFTDVEEHRPGDSGTPELAGLEHHGDRIPPEFNELETIVLEARRP